MPTARRRQGPVERATRAMVKALGGSSARQKVTAEAAFKLARLVDDEADGSKASALSRELRQLVAAITPLVGEVPAARPQEGEAHADAVQRVQDEVARKRRARAQGQAK